MFFSESVRNKTNEIDLQTNRKGFHVPLARISVPQHLPAAKIRALADAVHEGLVSTCNVPPRDRFQLISGFSEDQMMIDPHFPDVARTADASIIEILFLEGRSTAQRAALFQHIANGAMAAGFQGDDIMVTLTENAATDWSLGFGRSYGTSHTPKEF